MTPTKQDTSTPFFKISKTVITPDKLIGELHVTYPNKLRVKYKIVTSGLVCTSHDCSRDMNLREMRREYRYARAMISRGVVIAIQGSHHIPG